jgi:hypothetical protein
LTKDAYAYHTEPRDKIVHPWTVGQITELALNDPEISSQFKEQLKKYKDQVIQASVDEDYFPKYPDWSLSNDFGKFDPGGMSGFFPKEVLEKFGLLTKPKIDRLPPNVRCVRHYYEPVSGKGLQFHIQWKSSLDFITWLQEDAKKAWAGCDYEKAFYRLGQVMHHLTESPAHFNSINHAPPVILGSQVPTELDLYKHFKQGDKIEDWAAANSPSSVFPDIKQLVSKIPAFTEKELGEIYKKVAKAQNVITAQGLVGEILAKHFYLDCKNNVGGYSDYNFSDKELRDLVRITIPLQIKAGGEVLRLFEREVIKSDQLSNNSKSSIGVKPVDGSIYRTLANLVKARNKIDNYWPSYVFSFNDKNYGKVSIEYCEKSKIKDADDWLMITIFSDEGQPPPMTNWRLKRFTDKGCNGLDSSTIDKTLANEGKYGRGGFSPYEDTYMWGQGSKPRGRDVSLQYDGLVKSFISTLTN